MVDEVLALGVLPILGVKGEGGGAERVVVLLGEFRKRDVLEAVETLEFVELGGGGGEPEDAGETTRRPPAPGFLPALPSSHRTSLSPPAVAANPALKP